MNIDNINKWAGKIKSLRMKQKEFCEENDINLVEFRKIMYSASDLSGTKTETYDAVETTLKQMEEKA